MNDILSLIGTPRYPLRRPNLMRVWRGQEGERIQDPQLEGMIRAIHSRKPFIPGMCYANTDTLVRNTQVYDYPIGSAAGWMITGGVPIHHCWAVMTTPQAKYLVIDLSSVFRGNELTDQFWREGGWEERRKKAEAGTWDDYVEYAVGWRKAFVEMLRPYEEGDIIENRVFGIVPKGVTYVGCPCNPDEARFEYRNWHSKYGSAGNAPGVPSLVQEIELAVKGGRDVGEIADRLKKAGPG